MIAVTTRTAVELLRFSDASHRATQAQMALARAAGEVGIDLVETTTYSGDRPWLCLWGPGNPARRDLMRAHVSAGGRVIAMDLAYWQRETKVRISIDSAHPQAWIFRRDWPRDRFDADHVRVADVWKPNGPIVIAGIGRKARVQYGHDEVEAWEVSMMEACRARWPNRLIVYRPKQADAPIPKGPMTRIIAGGQIEHVLTGASLLITWHSNVAVDAIRMGIPVVCRDGAARAVAPETLSERDPEPLDSATRDRFLVNLAWFQWAPPEAAACWRWISDLLTEAA